MKNFFLFLLAAFVLFSCSEEDNQPDTGSMTPAEATALVDNSLGAVEDDIVSLVQSDGVDAMISMLDLFYDSQAFGRLEYASKDQQKQYILEQSKVLSQLFVEGVASVNSDVPEDGGDEFGDIETTKGIYEWSFELNDFEKTGESDILVIAFPTEGSTENNAEFRLTAVEIEEFVESYDGYEDRYEQPTVIKADLSIDDSKFIDLDFEVDYSAEGIPVFADITMLVVPFTFSLDFDDTNSGTSSVSASISKDSELITAVSVEVIFVDAEKEEVKSIDGSVSYRALKIQGDIDVLALDNSEDGDPNDYINLALFSDDKKIGDIEFVLEEIEPGYEDYVAYVTYSDGSKENLEDLLKSVEMEIEDFFESIEDEA
ncbi:MAG: hypothetical protein KI790_16885 [Cyclobacteriaceae bacterium]|nr:hypothetical protein [Cyclobacteriaceae bacterium HetDA_MAG_MS6]